MQWERREKLCIFFSFFLYSNPILFSLFWYETQIHVCCPSKTTRMFLIGQRVDLSPGTKNEGACPVDAPPETLSTGESVSPALRSDQTGDGEGCLSGGGFYPIASPKTGEDFYEAIFSPVGDPDDHENFAGTRSIPGVRSHLFFSFASLLSSLSGMMHS